MIEHTTTSQLYFRDPKESPPPRNSSLLLLTVGGTLAIGKWSEDCIGWCPKPRIPLNIKLKLQEQFLESIKNDIA